MGRPVDETCDVLACYPKHRGQSFLPVTKFTWLPPVEFPKSLDSVGQIAAVVGSSMICDMKYLVVARRSWMILQQNE